MLTTKQNEFIKEKRFLDNLSERTLKYYGYVFNRWNDYVGDEPTAQNIKIFVVKIRESGVTAQTTNSYIRGFNAYLTWLESGLVIKKVKEPQRLLNLFTDKQIKALIAFRGTTFPEKRMNALITMLTDTGIRINEALTIKRSDVDFDNMLFSVIGKGNKERLLPFSIQLRKVLYRYWKSHHNEYLFPAQGGTWAYRSALDQFKRLCKNLGIEGTRTSFHTIRHYFAVNFIRAGGDIYRLSRILGHTDIKTTVIYLQHMGIEPVQKAQAQFSPLARL